MSTSTANSSSTASSAMNGLGAMKDKLSGMFTGPRQVLILAILASVVACVIVLMLWTGSTGYRPLYGDQEHIDSGQIINVLESTGTKYRIDAQTGQILVPENQVGEVRMMLAAHGVKAKMPAAWDEMNKTPIGTSQFMEVAQYRHTLEGELARTIMALNQVRSARVHLAIPKNTLFIRTDPEKPTASVMLDLYAGAKLDPQQVEAIANLVAGSVTGMSPGSVQIVDQAGDYLSADLASNQDITQAKDKQLGYTNELEHNLIKRAENMLTPILGAHNYQVQIAATVNFNQVEETQESLDPKGVVTQENIKSNKSSNTLGVGIPGSLSNTPATAPKNGANGQNNDSTDISQQQSRQFSVGKAVRHTRFQQMQLQKLSVSVLVNKDVAGKDGWQPNELNQIGTMVKDAIGFDQARGDTFSISNFTFLPVKKVDFKPLPWWQSIDYPTYLRYLIGGLLGLGLIFFVLRPLVSHLISASGSQSRAKALELSNSSNPQLPGKTNDALAPGNTDSASLTPGQTALSQGALPSPGSPLTVKMEHLALLANDDPARVAEVISHWIRDKDSE